MAQRIVPTVYMRGGTSRALIFNESDLPPVGQDGDTSDRDSLFCGAIGSPDPYKRQLNGVGGGVTSLSKIAIVGPPTHPDADIDYTFGQVDVTQPLVGYRANCGNISSAIGPYAVDEGLVASPCDGTASVVIHNTNTGKLIRATFEVVNGKAVTEGIFKIDGVAGSGACVKLAFLDPAGAVTGRLLPTGHTRDQLVVAGHGSIELSIVDASTVVAFVDAASIGLAGDERPDALARDPSIMDLLRQIRITASVAAGMIAKPDDGLSKLRNLPLVAVVSPSSNVDEAGSPRVQVRMVSSDQPHGASPLTGAMCTAVAAQIDGTIVREAISHVPRSGEIIVDHATGSLPVAATVERTGDHYRVRESIVLRTARRLMDGRVYAP